MDEQHSLFGDSPAASTPSEAASDDEIIAQVETLVRAIPAGRVMSYGAVGAACRPPISGYICGRIMNRSAREVPWWRVVAKDGALPINKRAPQLAAEQRRRLTEEGVHFDSEGRVARPCFVTAPCQPESG